MDGYIQTGIGVLVSVVLFLIGYRQTIGARRERMLSANNSIYKALIRRLVLEDYSPKINELELLIEGKAHAFKVQPSSLHSNEQLLTRTFAEIFDNDFIAPEKRVEIESRLTEAIDSLLKSRRKINENDIIKPELEKRRRLLMFTLVILASLTGTVVSLFLIGDQIKFSSDERTLIKQLIPVLAAFIASVSLISGISIVKRVREAPEPELARIDVDSENALFEKQVAIAFSKLKIPFIIKPKIGLLRPDLVVNIDGKKVVAEIKSWRTPPPFILASRVAKYVHEALRAGNFDAALVITRGRLSFLNHALDSDDVSFVALKELENWIKLFKERTMQSSELPRKDENKSS